MSKITTPNNKKGEFEKTGVTQHNYILLKLGSWIYQDVALLLIVATNFSEKPHNR